jgi:hypothetical protein
MNSFENSYHDFLRVPWLLRTVEGRLMHVLRQALSNIILAILLRHLTVLQECLDASSLNATCCSLFFAREKH